MKYCAEYDRTDVVMPYIVFHILNIFGSVAEAKKGIRNLIEPVVATMRVKDNDEYKYAVHTIMFTDDMIIFGVDKNIMRALYMRY